MDKQLFFFNIYLGLKLACILYMSACYQVLQYLLQNSDGWEHLNMSVVNSIVTYAQ